MITQTDSLRNSNLDFSYVLKRTLLQIIDTCRFEFKRHFKKTILIIASFVSVFVILFLLNFVTFSNSNNILPVLPGDYIKSTYLIVINLMILVLGILYGSSIIVEDFENQTGNYIFPNTTKFRLLIGRLISGFVLGSISLLVFYILITLDTMYEYGVFHVPIELLYSFGWALIYFFMLLSLTVFFSSFSKSSSITIILMLLFILVVTNILNLVSAIARYYGEPFFILTYFSAIITEILTYPVSRSVNQPLNFVHVKINGQELSFTQWITPSPIEALVFMISYSLTFLIISYFFYERRQVQ